MASVFLVFSVLDILYEAVLYKSVHKLVLAQQGLTRRGGGTAAANPDIAIERGNKSPASARLLRRWDADVTIMQVLVCCSLRRLLICRVPKIIFSLVVRASSSRVMASSGTPREQRISAIYRASLTVRPSVSHSTPPVGIICLTLPPEIKLGRGLSPLLCDVRAGAEKQRHVGTAAVRDVVCTLAAKNDAVKLLVRKQLYLLGCYL